MISSRVQQYGRVYRAACARDVCSSVASNGGMLKWRLCTTTHSCFSCTAPVCAKQCWDLTIRTVSPTSRVYTGSGICVKKRHINLLVCAALRYFAPSTAVLLPGFFALSKRRDIALRRSALHFSPPSCNLLVHSSQNISIRIIYNTCSRQPRTTQRSKAPEQNNARHPPLS